MSHLRAFFLSHLRAFWAGILAEILRNTQNFGRNSEEKIGHWSLWCSVPKSAVACLYGRLWKIARIFVILPGFWRVGKYFLLVRQTLLPIFIPFFPKLWTRIWTIYNVDQSPLLVCTAQPASEFFIPSFKQFTWKMDHTSWFLSYFLW